MKNNNTIIVSDISSNRIRFPSSNSKTRNYIYQCNVTSISNIFFNMGRSASQLSRIISNHNSTFKHIPKHNTTRFSKLIWFVAYLHNQYFLKWKNLSNSFSCDQGKSVCPLCNTVQFLILFSNNNLLEKHTCIFFNECLPTHKFWPLIMFVSSIYTSNIHFLNFKIYSHLSPSLYFPLLTFYFVSSLSSSFSILIMTLI